MSVKINLGAWNSVFAVPSAVVDEGLKFADGVKLKVLLFVLRNSGADLELEVISKATGVSVTDIPEALEYWVTRDILQKTGSVLSPVSEAHVDPVVAEIKAENDSPKEKKTVESISKEVEEQKQKFVVTKPQKPDYVYTSQRLATDGELKFLVGEAQTALGKPISNNDAATLLMLKDTCGLKPEVILMLLQYCVSIDMANMRTVEKIGVSWSDEGINSVDAADKKIARARHSSKCFTTVSTAFGLQNAGSPTKKQLEYSTKWVSEWKFSSNMLREAYERCVDTKGSVRFSYIDGILKKWEALGIRNPDDLKAHESGGESAKPAPKKNTSYNIKELEKIDTLDFID